MSVFPQSQYPFGYQYPIYYSYSQVPQPPAVGQLNQFPPQGQIIPQSGFYGQVPTAGAGGPVAPHYLANGSGSPGAGSPGTLHLPFYYYNNINEKKSKSSTTWTAKEDKLLRELKENQKLGWRDISTFFNDRTPNACQFRWRRIISSISKTTESEGPANSATISTATSAIVSTKMAKSRSSSISSMLNPHLSQP
ncbi:hypothetical protein PSN45_001222 [Yamadazyma tenuis]|uniref:uncharacterized protein n=1 Tax=Candida tenuis TaxID=2315449 RepID=UPI0027A99DE1|nr:hypothetical protein PSN45_001222 [Yamadazyma tenuis]